MIVATHVDAVQGRGGLYLQADFTYSDDYYFDVFNREYTSQDSYTIWGARTGYIAASGAWEDKMTSSMDHLCEGMQAGSL